MKLNLAIYNIWCYNEKSLNILLTEGRVIHPFFFRMIGHSIQTGKHACGRSYGENAVELQSYEKVCPGKEKGGMGMSKRETYEQKTEELLLPIVEEHQFELVDVEYVKEGSNWYLRAYIDKPGGITVDDCEVVSRRLSDLLDEKDYIEDAYILEVSSPGLGRPLKKDKDFARSIGEEVEIRTFRAIGHEKEFTGILKDFDKEKIVIELEDNEIMNFARDNIALVRLAFDF